MAVSLKHIKKINSADVINTYQLLLSAMFGNKTPEPYDTEKTYVKGEPIIKTNLDGSYTIMVAKEDGVTGAFNESKWNAISFTDLFKEGSSLDIDFSKAIQMQTEQPTAKDTVLWLHVQEDLGNMDLNFL